MASDLTGLAYVVLTLGVAVIAAVAALAGHWLARLGAREADRRWQRERTFDLLDKAVARALSQDDRVSRVGVAQLTALTRSELLQPEDDDLVDAVTDAVLADTLKGGLPDRVIV